MRDWLATPVQNPFQSADLRKLPWWGNVTLYDDMNTSFEAWTSELEESFRRSVADGKLGRVARDYRRIARAIVERLPAQPLVGAILEHSFARLVTIYCYLRQRRKSPRQFLGGSSSIVRMEIEKKLLATALKQADRMQQAGVTHQKFDVGSSPQLLRWIREQYWPAVSEFCGMAALPIVYAHIRCHASDKHGDEYRQRFRYHRFGNHHYDQDVYSLPLIIYLSEVSASSGPFEYLSASDEYAHNFVLRAFHQSLNHNCEVSSLYDKSFAAIASLPSVFRGGDVVGNLYPEAQFELARPGVVQGGIGTAVMFDGFNAIHAGGLPAEGYRKSLFVNFRFPVAKIVPKVRSLFLA